MLTKRTIAVVAMILLGTVSGALAKDYRAEILRLGVPIGASSIENARLQLERRNATRFTAEEKALFDLASQLD
jgi:hypothetical protein